MGGDPPVTYYLAAGKKLSDLLAVTGVSALLSTTAPVRAAGCEWKPIGSQAAGQLTLNRTGINWNTVPTTALLKPDDAKPSPIPNGVLIGNGNLAPNGAKVPIGGKTWAEINKADQIYFGAVNQDAPDPKVKDAKLSTHQQTHQFYITGKLADGTDLASAIVSTATSYKVTDNSKGTSAITTGPLPYCVSLPNFSVPAGSRTYVSDGTKFLLLCLTNGTGPSLSQAIFQISDFTIDATGMIKIQWSPPATSQNDETYVGPLAGHTGAANSLPYTVQLALCPVKDGKGVPPVPPPAQIGSIMQ
jgi:hypothetical protein